MHIDVSFCIFPTWDGIQDSEAYPHTVGLPSGGPFWHKVGGLNGSEAAWNVNFNNGNVNWNNINNNNYVRPVRSGKWYKIIFPWKTYLTVT